MELGSVKGLESFLGSQVTAPLMGKHHSAMCWGPTSLLESTVVTFWVSSGISLGHQRIGNPFSRHLLCMWKCLRHFSWADEWILSACQEPPTPAMDSFFKVRKVGKSLKCKRAQFPSFSHPQMTPFQVWGILSSCKHHFCQTFHFW